MQTTENKKIFALSYEALVKRAMALLVAGTIALSGCDKPGDEPEPEPNPGGGGNEPKVIVDNRSNATAKSLIENYLKNRIPARNFETDEELTEAAVAYVNRVLYIGNKDTVSTKLAKVGFYAAKAGNYNTFDYVTPYVEITSGNNTDREGKLRVVDAYDPQSRSFANEYVIQAKEK